VSSTRSGSRQMPSLPSRAPGAPRMKETRNSMDQLMDRVLANDRRVLRCKATMDVVSARDVQADGELERTGRDGTKSVRLTARDTILLGQAQFAKSHSLRASYACDSPGRSSGDQSEGRRFEPGVSAPNQAPDSVSFAAGSGASFFRRRYRHAPLML
jgi:hypothetical protein